MHDVLAQEAAPYIAHGTLALFGAVVHALNAYREDKTKSIKDHLVLGTIASFTGVVFGLVGISMFGAASYPALILTALGGYVGPPGMTYMTTYILEKYQIVKRKDETK